MLVYLARRQQHKSGVRFQGSGDFEVREQKEKIMRHKSKARLIQRLETIVPKPLVRAFFIFLFIACRFFLVFLCFCLSFFLSVFLYFCFFSFFISFFLSFFLSF
jgi:hypothetical protein